MPSKIFAWRRDEVPIDRNVILLSNIKSLCRKFDFVSEQTQSHQCCFYLCASFAYLRRYVHINIYVHKPVVFKGMNRVCGFWASRMHQISSAGFKDVGRVKWLNQMFFLSFRQIWYNNLSVAEKLHFERCCQPIYCIWPSCLAEVSKFTFLSLQRSISMSIEKPWSCMYQNYDGEIQQSKMCALWHGRPSSGHWEPLHRGEYMVLSYMVNYWW